MSTAATSKTTQSTAMEGKRIMVRKPFTLNTDADGSYINVEFSTPMQIRILKGSPDSTADPGNTAVFAGNILSVTPEGLLAESTCPVCEQDILLLDMAVQNREHLDNILGVVKRSERSEDNTYIFGVEFVSCDYLLDHLAQSEMSIFDGEIGNFAERIERILSRYVYFQN